MKELLILKKTLRKNRNMNSNNKVHELIDKRWSPRAFDSRKVEKDKLGRLFEAARRAPSSSNEQPWRFLLGQKGEGETWDKIYSVMDDFNQLWTHLAPVLGVVIAKNDFAKTGEPNKHCFYDCGQAMAYLTMQATVEGLFVHQMAGFYFDKTKDVFKIPSGFEPITAFAIGYIGNPEILPERMQKTEYKKIIRNELSEEVFSAWGKSFSF
jgi:nitroreductase